MPAYHRVVIAALATALALVGLPASAVTRAVSSPKHYVALGDSYAVGPLIPVQRADPIGCERSTSNYPALLAAALHIHDYTDVSCSGATTVNMTAANPCERQATAGGTDRYAQRIAATAPKVAQVLQGIRKRSPRATVLLVGYLRILPPTIGCYPAFPIARGDVPYLDGVHQQLTAMLAGQAVNHGAVFVDSYAAALGRDACQLAGVKWVEGTGATSPAAPVHPNATGMHAVAAVTLDVLRDLDEATLG